MFANKGYRTCYVVLPFDSEGIILGSLRPSGATRFSIAFVEVNSVPEKQEYDYEIRNETRVILSAKAHAFEDGGDGYRKIDELSEEFVSHFVGSKVLYVKTDGAGPVRYDLGRFGRAFRRFSDCLKGVENRKAAAVPTPRTRRMN